MSNELTETQRYYLQLALNLYARAQRVNALTEEHLEKDMGAAKLHNHSAEQAEQLLKHFGLDKE